MIHGKINQMLPGDLKMHWQRKTSHHNHGGVSVTANRRGNKHVGRTGDSKLSAINDSLRVHRRRQNVRSKNHPCDLWQGVGTPDFATRGDGTIVLHIHYSSCD